MSYTKLCCLYLFTICFLLNVLITNAQESGWDQRANAKYQIAEIDTILQHGISITGDTLWTFCKDSTLYFWDLSTGKLTYKKKLDDIYRISIDLKSYTKITSTKGDSIKYQLTVFDLLSDNIKFDVHIFGHENSYRTSSIPNYEVYNDTLMISYIENRYGSKNSVSTTKKHCLIKLSKDKISFINEKAVFTENFVFDDEQRSFVSSYYFHTSDSYYGTFEYKSSLAFGTKDNKQTIITENSRDIYSGPSDVFYSYSKPIFTTIKNHISASAYPEIQIWDVTTKSLIKRLSIKNQASDFYDYCFLKNNEFIVFSKNEITLFDVKSKRIIDRISIDNVDKNISLKYSTKYDKLLFFAANKFGIYESEYFDDIDVPKISYDSNHVYSGNSVNFYLLNKKNYDKVEWFSSKGLIGEGLQPALKFEDVGVESITVKLTLGNENFEKVFYNIIEVLPQLSADFSADTTFGEAPLTVNFFNKSTGNIVSYDWLFWDVNNNTYKSNLENPTITFEKNGYYNVRFITKDKFNQRVHYKTLYIVVGRSKVIVPEIIQIASFSAKSIWVTQSKSYVTPYSYSPGIAIINNRINLYKTSHYGYNTRPLEMRNLDYDLNTIKETTIGNMLGYDQFSEVSIDNKKNILVYGAHSKASYLTKHNTDVTEIKNKVIDESLGFDGKRYINTVDNFHFATSSNINKTYILKFDKDLNLISSDSLLSRLHGATEYQNDKLVILHKTLNNNDLYLKYYNTDFVTLYEYLVDNLDSINVNYIARTSDNNFAFCGIDSSTNYGVVGMMSQTGELQWITNVDNWVSFRRLILKNRKIYAFGQSECFIGYIEIDYDGNNLNCYGFYDGGVANTIDVDYLGNDTVFLTYTDLQNKIIKIARSNIHSIPVIDDNEDDTDTTKIPIDIEHKFKYNNINAQPNPAFDNIEFQLDTTYKISKVEICDLSGKIIKSIIYDRQILDKIRINLRYFSIGVFYVKIYTDSGILIGKFIKY